MPLEAAPLRFVGIPSSAVPLALGKQLVAGFNVIGQRVMENAVATVPRQSGRLAASHYYLVGIDSSGTVTCQVGATEPYAASVHEGSRAHEIVPVRAQALRFVKDGQVIFASRVWHPGTHPNRWLWNATTRVVRMMSVSSERIVNVDSAVSGTSLGEIVSAA